MGTAAMAGAAVRHRAGRRLAASASVVGVVYLAISAYWGLGGTWLLDTVGASLTARQQSVTLAAAVWAAVVAKAAGVLIPLVAARAVTGSRWRRPLRLLAWAEGAVLTVYGFVLTAVGLLVQTGVVQPGASADRRALAWHAYLWDPWFLVWGLLVVAALMLTRPAS